jgi:serpin B
MRKTIIQKTLSSLLAFVLSACSMGPGASAGSLAISNQAREPGASASAADRQSLAQGNTAFALDLYRALNTEEGNQFFSPFSISLALAMTYAGARGETAQQMAEVLHFNLPPEKLHPAVNALDQELASRKDLQNGTGKDGKGFRLNIVNDLWGQKDYTFLQEYLDLLAKNYGAGMRLVDFKGSPEASRKQINDYIAEKTEQRIKDLIPSSAIDPYTRLVLTNAIYFNAAWLHPFTKELTRDEDFTLLDGSKVQAPMMLLPGSEQLRYLKGQGFQAAALPYENDDLAMLLLVPDDGNFEAFEAALDGDELAGILADMQSTPVVVQMPRFTFESEFMLADPLMAMGMQDAFNPDDADFSGMNGDRELYISEVIHKAFVGVDEAGTEAAAATAVIMRVESAPPSDPVVMTVDRPFIFMIYDAPTSTILFLGKVTNPLSQ